jgi:hypothetical protein
MKYPKFNLICIRRQLANHFQGPDQFKKIQKHQKFAYFLLFEIQIFQNLSKFCRAASSHQYWLFISLFTGATKVFSSLFFNAEDAAKISF